MSWNSSIQFAKLYKAYLTLSTTALTNPMIANLNMATYNINNVNTINAITGTTLTLYADPAQGVTVNTKLLIPNHPLIMTNNTADDSLQVGDNVSDTSVFRVDHNGNVGIKSNPSFTLGHALVVNGSVNVTGHINVPTLPAGTNDTQVANTAFVQSAIGSSTISAVNGGTGISTTTASGVVTVNNSGVTSIVAGSNITLSGATGAVTINSIENGVSSVNVGTGISTTANTGAITLTNSGVTSLTAGSNITLSGSTGALTITNSGIRTLTAGTAITLSGTTNDPIITNSGIRTLTAGTAITLSGTTNDPTITNSGVTSIIAGTAMTISGGTGAVTVNNNGVTSIVAGANISISGATGAVTISATPTSTVSNGAVSFTNIALDSIGTPTNIPPNQIGNCFVFCNNSPPVSAHTINLPSATQLASQFGANAVVNMFIGQLNVTVFSPSYPNIALQVGLMTGTGTDSYWSTNYTTQAPNSALTTKVWTSYNTSFAFLFPALYKVQITIQGGRAYHYFEYAGFAFP